MRQHYHVRAAPARARARTHVHSHVSAGSAARSAHKRYLTTLLGRVTDLDRHAHGTVVVPRDQGVEQDQRLVQVPHKNAVDSVRARGLGASLTGSSLQNPPRHLWRARLLWQAPQKPSRPSRCCSMGTSFRPAVPQRQQGPQKLPRRLLIFASTRRQRTMWRPLQRALCIGGAR